MNPNCWGGDHAAMHVEQRAMRWLAEMLGFPDDGRGHPRLGRLDGELHGARRRAPRDDAGQRPRGRPRGPDGPRLTVYASDQVHSCVDKAVDLLGIGTRQLRKIATDEVFGSAFGARSRPSRRTEAGFLPAIVVGNAGTVNTGAIDPLDELADFCRARALVPRRRRVRGARLDRAGAAPLFAGMERADSIAADPHKWLYVPYEAGATLVREPGRFSAAFRKFPEYLASDPESPFPGPAWFAERGVELSRGFKALKVWMGLKTHGRRAYAAIEDDVALGQFLAAEVDRRPDFERLAERRSRSPTSASARRTARSPTPQLDRINRRIINRLVGDGSFFLAPTILKGRDRDARLDHEFRTREEDLIALLDESARIGRELVGRRRTETVARRSAYASRLPVTKS